MNTYKQNKASKRKRTGVKLTIIIVFLVHSFFPGNLRADEQGVAGIHGNGKEESQALHKKAVEAAVGGNYVLATNLWIKAYAAYKNPRFSYNLARMAMEMDRPSSAMNYFKRFVEEAPKTAEYKELIERAERHIVDLQERVATLEIICEQQGVSISLNGEYLGTAPLRRTVTVDPGRHVLAAMLEKHHTQTLVADPQGGQTHRFEVSLEPIKGELVEVKIKEQTRLKYMMPRWVPWSIMGVGLVMGGVSAGLFVRSQQLYDDYDNPRNWAGGVPDTSLQRSADRHKNAGISFAVIGGVALAGGVVSLALNHVLAKEVPIDGEKETTSLRRMIVPVVLPGGGGLGAFGRF